MGEVYARDTPLTPAVRVFTLYCKTPLLKLRMVEFIQTIQTLCGPLALLASYRAAEHQTWHHPGWRLFIPNPFCVCPAPKCTREPKGSSGLLAGPLAGRSSTERLCCWRHFWQVFGYLNYPR